MPDLNDDKEYCKSLFNVIKPKGVLETSGILTKTSDYSLIFGHTLLVADSPNCEKHIMIFNFKNQGLSSLLGTMLTYETFSGMVKKGFSYEHVIREVSDKLRSFLPEHLSCYLTYILYSQEEDALKIWNGCEEPLFFFSQKDQTLVKQAGLCVNLNAKDFQQKPITIFSIPNAHEHFIFYQKTSQDACSLSFQEIYDLCQTQQKLKQWFEEPLSEHWLHFFALYIDPSAFIFKASIQDKVTCDQSNAPIDLEVDFKLSSDALKTWDPLPVIMHILMEHRALRGYRTEIFTILTELYANALDHGVLKLDSKIKKAPEGIVEYYKEKEKRLQNLTDGYITIKLELKGSDQNGVLIFTIKDSGEGFNQAEQKVSNLYSGRGLPLIEALCSQIQFFDQGSKVKAMFEWH